MLAALIGSALLAAASGSLATPSQTTAARGHIVVRCTETLKLGDVPHGGVAGTGHFTISGAISDKGTVTDYQTVKGNTTLIRRVTVGRKGTITFLITTHPGQARESLDPWTITSGTNAYRGLHGTGFETLANASRTPPATYRLEGTVSG